MRRLHPVRRYWIVLVAAFLVAHVASASAQTHAAAVQARPSSVAPSEHLFRLDDSDDGGASGLASAVLPQMQEQPIPQPPEDPCLPRLYRDWRELSLADSEAELHSRFRKVKLLVDRSHFLLTVEGVASDGSTEEVYWTHIGLGEATTPTPAGRFFVNHIYCYPDVMYFDPDTGPVPRLYKGLLAPIMICTKDGQCRRYRELGLHGFDASAYPHCDQLIDQTYGPVSGGCIRVPHPCVLKALLIRLVGIGPLRKNDRGCYHWLNHPIEVVIEGEYPWFGGEEGLPSLFSNGLTRMHKGLRSFIGFFKP